MKRDTEKLGFIYKRHSVREFKDTNIPIEDIFEIIRAATYAPSGGNKQNWHFVIMKNKSKIKKLSKIIEEKNEELVNNSIDEEKRVKFRKYLKFQTCFKSAPILILVFSCPYDGWDYTLSLSLLKEMKVQDNEIEYFIKTDPGIQNIGAAIENLILAATSMGYGTCWMTSANFAIREIERFINLKKEGYSLVAMIPVGIPNEIECRSPARKPLEEVITIIK